MDRQVRLVMLGLAFSLGCDASDEDGGDAPTEDPCESEDRADEYSQGLVQEGLHGVVAVTLVSAVPAPPEKGDNVWDLRVAGSLPDTAIVVVTPWMPDHGHGTPIDPVVEDGEAADELRISALGFFMSGYWETKITFCEDPDTCDVDDAETFVDQVMFPFCMRE